MLSDAEDLEKDAADGNAPKIAQGFDQLATSLKTLHDQAQQAEQEEQQAPLDQMPPMLFLGRRIYSLMCCAIGPHRVAQRDRFQMAAQCCHGG